MNTDNKHYLVVYQDVEIPMNRLDCAIGVARFIVEDHHGSASLLKEKGLYWWVDRVTLKSVVAVHYRSGMVWHVATTKLRQEWSAQKEGIIVRLGQIR